MDIIQEQVFLCTISECLSDEERSLLTARFLSDVERKKLLLLKDEKKRDEYLQSHAFINFILSQKLEVSPSSISFYRNNYGKPFIREEINQKKNFFSLAHTAGLTGLIISKNEAVGIDVEKRVFPKDLSSLEEIVLHEEELIEAKNITDKIERADNLYKKWVIKESILKADGRGLSLDPKLLLIIEDAKGTFKVRSNLFDDAQSFNICYKTFKNYAVAYTLCGSENTYAGVETWIYNCSNFAFNKIG